MVALVLNWTRLDWAGLLQVGLRWVGLLQAGLGWAGLVRTTAGMGWCQVGLRLLKGLVVKRQRCQD